MKTILFIRDLTEKDIPKIDEALESTRVEYTVSLSSKAVIVEGRNDIVHAAKVSLREVGLIVE